MNTRLITVQEQWDRFLLSSLHGSFLQSWSWGGFQEKMGAKVWRLAEEQDSKIQAVAQIIKRPLPFRQCYLYVPRGPVVSEVSEASQAGKSNIEHKIIELARNEKALFLRIEPVSPLSPTKLRSEAAASTAGGKGGLRGGLSGQSWLKLSQDVQPRLPLVLDLRPSEEELLAAMHQKTRYNIRLAEKKGVTVRFSTESADVEHFLRLKKEVEARGRFHFHPDEYYRQMVKISEASKASTSSKARLAIELATAEYKGETLAANILISFGDTVTYLHGASNSQKRDLMAPHLLQWASIKRAKDQGYKKYDFWGVAPPLLKGGGRGGGSKHPWSGITRFKEGFGGERKSYPGAYDYVLQPGQYWLHNIGRKLYSVLR